MTRKCFNCKAPIKSKKNLYCVKCKGKPAKPTAPTYIIFDKI